MISRTICACIFFTVAGFADIQLTTLTPAEVEEHPMEFDMHWNRQGTHFAFHANREGAGFSILVPKEEGDKLVNVFLKKCKKTDEGYVFSYHHGGVEDSAHYCLAKRRIVPEGKPKRISVNALAQWVKTKKVVFYTGAGISVASGVPTMHQLERLFDFGDKWVEAMARNPEEVVKKIRFFHRTCFSYPPTKAHWSLKNVALSNNIPVLTENHDILHQKTGIAPFCVSADRVRKEVSKKDIREIDAIICIGLSFDDKGLLGYYKDVNPNGKLISIDLQQPSYLSDEDYLLEGDIQEVLPLLEADYSINRAVAD